MFSFRIILGLFKEIFWTLFLGSFFAGGLLFLSSHYRLSIPEPHQRPIFFIGVLLFAVAFRLLMSIREEGEN